MKFMLIMQGTKSGWESMSTWSPADLQAHIGFMVELAQELSGSGELVMAEGLDLPHNAKVVTATEAGSPVVSDGPFPESKEFLAGFWLVDVETPDRAVEIAAKASTAPGKGGEPIGIPIEVRAIGVPPDVG
jgi:hypothetical protein